MPQIRSHSRPLSAFPESVVRYETGAARDPAELVVGTELVCQRFFHGNMSAVERRGCFFHTHRRPMGRSFEESNICSTSARGVYDGVLARYSLEHSTLQAEAYMYSSMT